MVSYLLFHGNINGGISISIQEKLCMARYGAIFRGNKVGRGKLSIKKYIINNK